MLKLDIVREYIAKFPGTPKQTVARIIFKENPAVWTSLEQVRNLVRSVTGSKGVQSRIDIKDKSLYGPPGKQGDPFGKLPPGLTHFRQWGFHVVPNCKRALILADLHIPYHDRKALKIALEAGKEFDPTHIILNGDFCDFFSVSFWEKDPRKRDLQGEIATSREVLEIIREGFPKAKIIFKNGNHEDRWERYLFVKAPELLGVQDFTISAMLRLASFKVEWVGEMRPVQIGKLPIVHGHEWKYGVTSPVNPARGFFLRAKESVLGAHLHRSSSHSEATLNGSVISSWSIGCLCDLHPDYSVLNAWNYGFAMVEVARTGMYQVHNRKIVKGQLFND